MLEIGCGKAVPSVRREGYEVVNDILNRNDKANVFYVRVNLNGG